MAARSSSEILSGKALLDGDAAPGAGSAPESKIGRSNSCCWAVHRCAVRHRVREMDKISH